MTGPHWTPTPRRGSPRSGSMPPMRAAWTGRGPRRHRVRSAARGHAARWPRIDDCAAPGPPGRSRCGSTARRPSRCRAGGGVLPRRRNGDGHPTIPSSRWPERSPPPAARPSSSVDYRLAPENPAARTVRRRLRRDRRGSPSNAERLGVDASRLAVVGDSAGGSLAAAVALAARDRGGPTICAQVLLYPGLDRDMAAPSITAMPDAPMLSPRRHRLHARPRRPRGWRTARPLPSARLRRRPVRPAAGDRRDRRMRSDPRLG